MTGGIIAIVIVLIAIGGVTLCVNAYYRLQRHRADAVAMAAYRKLAEQAVANQEALHERVRELADRLGAVEQLLRSVE
jgi:hypothetical protein